MSIVKDKAVKKKISDEYKSSEKDNGGSSEAQIALLTHRIRNLTEHSAKNKNDLHSKRGLLLMVNRRRKLLEYLKGRDARKYEELIKKLALRK